MSSPFKRRHLWLSVAFLLLVAIGLALWLRPRGDTRFAQAMCDQIRVGMTKAEVEATLSGTPGNYSKNQSISILSVSDPLPPAVEEEDWIGNSGMISVGFDGEGRVVHKQFTKFKTAAGFWLEEVWRRIVP